MDTHFKKSFVGVDSDGTAFDTMTIKHREAFIPAMIEVFGLERYRDDVFSVAEKINLFSQTRGINRFPGLLMTFDALSEKIPEFNVGNTNKFRDFINSGSAMSADALKEYISESNDDFLKRVLAWSELGDVIFSKKAHGLQPFPYVKEALERLSGYADIAVVSAASGKGLRKDWENGGILKYVSSVMGQEEGAKAEQIKKAARGKYDMLLMIGDADGDYRAAKQNGAMFYPIIPRNEEASWRSLYEKYADIFVNGEYTECMEKELYGRFLKSLAEGE